MYRENVVNRVYHFPQLHNGDCFYDILSRFHGESGHFSSIMTSRELFGSCPDLRPSIVLPYRASLIYTWLSPQSNISPEILRDMHSAWQYLQLDKEFTNDELVPIFSADTKPGRRKQTRMRWVLQNNISRLRYCPQCLVADYLREGEPFWHQSHQIFGVRYCPIHEIPLLDSDVSLEKRLVHFVPASTVLFSSSIDEMVSVATAVSQEERPWRDSYLRLAKTIDWLLAHGLEFAKSDYAGMYREIIDISAGDSVCEGERMVEYLLDNLEKGFLEDLFSDGKVDAFLKSIQDAGIESLSPLGHALFLMVQKKNSNQW